MLYAVASFSTTPPRFRLRQQGLADLVVCNFSARSAEKLHTIEKESTTARKKAVGVCAPTAVTQEDCRAAS
jgi:hypothetical protein